MKTCIFFFLISFIILFNGYSGHAQKKTANPTPTYTITGYVIDSVSRRPLSSVAIDLVNVTGGKEFRVNGRSDGRGIFRFELKNSISGRLEFRRDNYYPRIYNFNEFRSQLNTGAIRMRPFPETVEPEQVYQVKGVVIDSITNRPLSTTNVVLTYENEGELVTLNDKTNTKGLFQFELKDQSDFRLDVSKKGYVSKSVRYGEFDKQLDIGQIKLIPGETASELKDTGKIQPVAEYVDNRLIQRNFVPTKGAIDLIYALNPKLLGIDSIKSNEEIIMPDLPDLNREKRRQFHRQFKRDKKMDPSLFTKAGYLHENMGLARTSERRTGMILSMMNQSEQFNERFHENSRVEKFVFVIWKKDSSGNIITKGSEVEGRFLIYYFGEAKRKDSLTWGRTADATYGYATMGNAKYNVIVVDQRTMKQKRISDSLIDTRIFFEKQDLLLWLNVKYIRIAIQMFE